MYSVSVVWHRHRRHACQARLLRAARPEQGRGAKGGRHIAHHTPLSGGQHGLRRDGLPRRAHGAERDQDRRTPRQSALHSLSDVADGAVRRVVRDAQAAHAHVQGVRDGRRRLQVRVDGARTPQHRLAQVRRARDAHTGHRVPQREQRRPRVLLLRDRVQE